MSSHYFKYLIFVVFFQCRLKKKSGMKNYSQSRQIFSKGSSLKLLSSSFPVSCSQIISSFFKLLSPLPIKFVSRLFLDQNFPLFLLCVQNPKSKILHIPYTIILQNHSQPEQRMVAGWVIPKKNSKMLRNKETGIKLGMYYIGTGKQCMEESWNGKVGKNQEKKF